MADFAGGFMQSCQALSHACRLALPFSVFHRKQHAALVFCAENIDFRGESNTNNYGFE